jgi:hypothetical protein
MPIEQMLQHTKIGKEGIFWHLLASFPTSKEQLEDAIHAQGNSF